MVPGDFPDIYSVKLIEISAGFNVGEAGAIEIASVQGRQKKLCCLRAGTFPLPPLLDANLDFLMWHFEHFWALRPVRGVLRAGTIFNCSLIIPWLLQNSPVLRNDSFWGGKKSPLLSIYKKICSQVPLLLFLFWLTQTLPTQFLVIPENSPESLWVP